MLIDTIKFKQFLLVEYPMKRTTVTLPQELVVDLLGVTSAKNKTQAVIGAIQECIRRKKMETIKRMADRSPRKKVGKA